MDLLRELLMLLYILGLAAVFGGFVHQVPEKNKNVNYAMFVGGLAQAAAFILLLIWRLVDGASFDTKSIIMLIVTLVIGALAFVFRKKTGDNLPVWLVVGLLSVFAFAVTFVWPTILA
jgi:hypothetical protein